MRILGAGDGPIDLPAAPATQRTRYGEQPYALVLEGREALFMKSGDVPLTCTALRHSFRYRSSSTDFNLSLALNSVL